MIELFTNTAIPLMLTSLFMLIAVLIDMMCSSPYSMFGIQLEYPQAPLAEKIAHLCFVLAAMSFCFVMGSYSNTISCYIAAFGCWFLTGAVIYAGTKIIASALIIVFRWEDFVNGKA